MEDVTRLDEISVSEQRHLASLAGWLDLSAKHLNKDTLRAVSYLNGVCDQHPNEWIPFHLLAQYDLKCWVGNPRHHVGVALLAAWRAQELTADDPRPAFGLATALRMAAYTGRDRHVALNFPEDASRNAPVSFQMKRQGPVATVDISPNQALVEALRYFRLTSELGVHRKDARLLADCVETVQKEVDDPEFLQWRISLGPAALRAN